MGHKQTRDCLFKRTTSTSFLLVWSWLAVGGRGLTHLHTCSFLSHCWPFAQLHSDAVKILLQQKKPLLLIANMLNSLLVTGPGLIRWGSRCLVNKLQTTLTNQRLWQKQLSDWNLMDLFLKHIFFCHWWNNKTKSSAKGQSNISVAVFALKLSKLFCCASWFFWANWPPTDQTGFSAKMNKNKVNCFLFIVLAGKTVLLHWPTKGFAVLTGHVLLCYEAKLFGFAICYKIAYWWCCFIIGLNCFAVLAKDCFIDLTA